MAVFYKYQYTNKHKNIHPCLFHLPELPPDSDYEFVPILLSFYFDLYTGWFF